MLRVSNYVADGHMNADQSLPHKASPLKGSHPNRASLHTAINGHPFHPHPSSRDTPSALEVVSDDESESGQDDDYEEEEVEQAPRKWQGIESVFEAYQQYADGKSPHVMLLIILNLDLSEGNYKYTTV